ncbi:unnamed protein product [Toxocara canis]|uniref:RRM domain-containing protein n=1 Tax=Toxocara canis TaxID=6265 RepID=A0A183UY47_TOXCA|nr:unnamed protein product [Toxocara canis]
MDSVVVVICRAPCSAQSSLNGAEWKVHNRDDRVSTVEFCSVALISKMQREVSMRQKLVKGGAEVGGAEEEDDGCEEDLNFLLLSSHLSGYRLPPDLIAGSVRTSGCDEGCYGKNLDFRSPDGFVSLGSYQASQRNVGFDTSSREPHLVRARVFVGNINNKLITREQIIDLFGAYGSLLGVTVLKGYAFVQYANAEEADRAVSSLSGRLWNGTMLLGKHFRHRAWRAHHQPETNCTSRDSLLFSAICDSSKKLEVGKYCYVKLAVTGMKKRESPTPSPKGVKRVAEHVAGDVKKRRTSEYCNVAEESASNQKSVEVEAAQGTNLYANGMADVLVCGRCRYVTSDFEEFKQHRNTNCTVTTSKKDEEEEWPCSMCDEVPASAAALVKHVLDRHKICLCKGWTN